MARKPHWSAQYIGIPYMANEETRQGADCWRLVRMCLREQFEIEIPRLDEYDDPNDVKRNAEFYDKHEAWRNDWREVSEAQEGDIIVIKLGGSPAHVGIIIGGTKFLHTRYLVDSCIENFHDTRWARRIESLWRHKSLW